MSNVGKTVKAHYRGTLEDGTQFDSSYDRGEPLEFTCMAGMMIQGFDNAVKDMEVGEKKTVHIPCQEAYGEYDKEAVIHFPAEQVPNASELPIGQTIHLQSAMGPIPAKVLSVDEQEVVVDMNHELAGKDLIFDIELVSVED